MRRILKYELEYKQGDRQKIELPRGSEIIDFNSQSNNLFIWTIVPQNIKQVNSRVFRVFGTGNNIPDDTPFNTLHFIKTCHTPSGYVWHLFEETIG